MKKISILIITMIISFNLIGCSKNELIGGHWDYTLDDIKEECEDRLSYGDDEVCGNELLFTGFKFDKLKLEKIVLC